MSRDYSEIELVVTKQKSYNNVIDFLNGFNKIVAVGSVGIYKPKLAERALYVEMGSSAYGGREPVPLFRTVFAQRIEDAVLERYFVRTAQRAIDQATPVEVWLKTSMDAWLQDTATELQRTIDSGFMNITAWRRGDNRPWIETGETRNAITFKSTKIKTRPLKVKKGKAQTTGAGSDAPVTVAGPKRSRRGKAPALTFRGMADAVVGEAVGSSGGRGRSGSGVRSFNAANALSGAARRALRYAAPDAAMISIKKSGSKKATRTRFTPQGGKSRRYSYNRKNI